MVNGAIDLIASYDFFENTLSCYVIRARPIRFF